MQDQNHYAGVILLVILVDINVNKLVIHGKNFSWQSLLPTPSVHAGMESDKLMVSLGS